MTDATPNAADLNAQEEPVAVVQPPAGAMRATPGGEAQDLGGVSRHVTNQQKEADDDAARVDDGAAPGSTDGSGDDPAAGDKGAADDAATGESQQPNETADGEGREAALQAALSELPEETRTALEPFSKEFAETGALSAESTAAAAAALGVPESLVKFHLTAVQAATPAAPAEADPVQAQLVEAAYEVAGGKEGYAPFREWLKSEGRAEDEKLLGDAIEAKNPAMLKRLMAPLYQEFQRSGAAPNTRRNLATEAASGETEQSAGVVGFETQQDMLKAMRERVPGSRKARYEADSEYRAQVNARIAASRFNTGTAR